jgi:GntR family galactonate operon transcriptional repressor
VLQGFRGAIDTILSAVFVVAVDSVDGWFEDNIPNHAAAARAIEEGNAKKARNAMERVLGYTQSHLAKRNRRANPRKGRPGKATDLKRRGK